MGLIDKDKALEVVYRHCGACSAAMKALPEAETKPQAKVLTMDEVKTARICWIEDCTETHDLLYPAIYYGKGNGGTYEVFLVDEDDPAFEGAEYEDSQRWLESGDVNKFWRPWDSKPTPEQMEAEQWPY